MSGVGRMPACREPFMVTGLADSSRCDDVGVVAVAETKCCGETDGAE